MDQIYKNFILITILLLFIFKIYEYYVQENFSNILKPEEVTQARETRENPPFEVINIPKEKVITEAVNDYDGKYYKAEDNYILIPNSKRMNWRRERDTIGKKSCNRMCKIHNKKAPYKSYKETGISEFGVIRPKIYSRKVGKRLEVSNTNSFLVPEIPNSDKLPFTPKTRAQWTCQREWTCFDPNTLLDSHFV